MSSRCFRLSLAAVLAALPLMARAHVPFDLPSSGLTLNDAVLLPDSKTSWVIYGLLSAPNQANFIRLNRTDQDPEGHVGAGNPDVHLSDLQMEVFTKPAYAKFNPSLALVAPGLPQPTEDLPFVLPSGYGAIVQSFTGDVTQREISAFGNRIWWLGQDLVVPDTFTALDDLTSLPSYLVVWDPQGGTGEYTVVYNCEPDVESDEFEGIYTNPADGDGNDDAKVDIADATMALQMAVGLIPVSPRRVRALDVYPPKDGKTMQGDGKIAISDVLRLLRHALGDDSDPFP